MVKVNRDLCIGCGACQAYVPDVFEIDDEGLATVTNSDAVKDNLDDVKEAIENCPTSAIEMDDEK